MNQEKTFFAHPNAGAQTQTGNTFWQKHLTTAHNHHGWRKSRGKSLQMVWLQVDPTMNSTKAVRLWQTDPVDFPRGHIAPNETIERTRWTTIHDLSAKIHRNWKLTPPKLYGELVCWCFFNWIFELAYACTCVHRLSPDFNLNLETIMIFTTGLAANKFWDTLTRIRIQMQCIAMLLRAHKCKKHSSIFKWPLKAFLKRDVPSWKLRFVS